MGRRLLRNSLATLCLHITAARAHCLGALYNAAAEGLSTLADKGYDGAGIGVHSPIKGRSLAVDNRSYNTLLTAVRAIGESADARVNFDKCAGQSFIRSYATLSVSTEDTVDVITYTGVTKVV